MKKLFMSCLAVLAFAATACSAPPPEEPEGKGESSEPQHLASIVPDAKTLSSLKTARSRLITSGDPIVWDDECFAIALPANDDGSTNAVDLPFPVNFFGTTYSSFFINNNGNVTFDAAMRTYTPFELTANTPPIIAAFLADVDTRSPSGGPISGLTTYSEHALDFEGRPAFCVSWIDVGYYSRHTDKRNSFQLLLVDRSDTGSGNFDIVLNYSRIEWETGDASGGQNGFGGRSAGAGFSAGNGDPTAFFQFPGSLVNGALLDTNTDTGLIHQSRGSSVPGRYSFQVRSGTPDVDLTPPESVASTSPASPDANGEFHGPVSVTIEATDDDSGVASITYSLSGATTGGGTVEGALAYVPIITEYGTTVVTYYATDEAGNVEAAHTLTITITPSGPSCAEVSLNDYNLFLLGDYTGGHDVEGKVAAGGSITMENFSVGARLAEDDTANVLVAGGDLNITLGGVFGDTFYGGSTTADDSVTITRGTLAQGTPIDFMARGDELMALSAALASQTVNGTTRREVWGGIFLEGSDPDMNVFEVDGGDFTGATYFSISAPAGSMVVVNILGDAATFTGFGHGYTGVDQTSILFNFPTASSITAHGYGFWGTVLAPYAHVDFSDGSFDGGLYAYSMSGNAEGHINPLRNFDFCAGGVGQ